MVTYLPYDYAGKRGFGGKGGRWVTLDDAKTASVGEDNWWEKKGVGGKTVAVKQYDPRGPPGKPIWMYQNGDMYLGPWKKGNKKGLPLENGFGVTYNDSPDEIQGLVYVGDWRGGLCHGAGKSLWLEESPAWTSNKWADSPITQKDGQETVGRPFVYVGDRVADQREDQMATVTLKDGTTRVGPWENGEPVGNWWKDHQAAASAAGGASRDTRDERTTRGAGGLTAPEGRITRSHTSTERDKSARKHAPEEVQSAQLKTEKLGGDESTGASLSRRANRDAARKASSTPKTRPHTSSERGNSTRKRAPEQGSSSPPKKKARHDSTVTPSKRANRHVSTKRGQSARKRAPEEEESTSPKAKKQAREESAATESDEFLDDNTLASDGQSSKKPAARPRGRSSIRSRNESVSLPPREIITLDDSDKLDGQDVVTSIADWLEGVIGYDPERELMEEYAQEFINEGLHSVQMIIDLCDPQIVTWMRRYHKQQFLANANLTKGA